MAKCVIKPSGVVCQVPDLLVKDDVEDKKDYQDNGRRYKASPHIRTYIPVTGMLFPRCQWGLGSGGNRQSLHRRGLFCGRLGHTGSFMLEFVPARFFRHSSPRPFLVIEIQNLILITLTPFEEYSNSYIDSQDNDNHR